MRSSGSATLKQRQFPHVQISLGRRYYFGTHLDYYEDTSLLQKKGNVKRFSELHLMSPLPSVVNKWFEDSTTFKIVLFKRLPIKTNINIVDFIFDASYLPSIVSNTLLTMV